MLPLLRSTESGLFSNSGTSLAAAGLIVRNAMTGKKGHSGYVLIVISGLPGTGKSAVAALVAAELEVVHLSIDLVEEALLGAGLPSSWQTGVAAYETVSAVAQQTLLLGRTVVVDAVNDSEAARRTWSVAAERTRTELVSVLLVLDDLEEHQRRLEGRKRGLTHIPEPSWEDVQQRAMAFAPWSGPCLRVNAGEPVAAVVQSIMGHLRH